MKAETNASSSQTFVFRDCPFHLNENEESFLLLSGDLGARNFIFGEIRIQDTGYVNLNNVHMTYFNDKCVGIGVITLTGLVPRFFGLVVSLVFFVVDVAAANYVNESRFKSK